MKKVFASDFDGTLYFYLAEDDRKLPAENVAKIREYQAAGHLFGLCTGRQVGGLTPFITGFVEPDFYITSSGANIVDTQFKEIRKKGVDPQVADAIIKKYGTDNFRFTLDVEGDICVFKEMDYPGKYYIITGVDDCPKGLIHQVSIHTESLEDAARMTAEINAEFGDKVTKEDVFYYIYGVLHSPDYRRRFEADLKKSLVRIPLPKTGADFSAFVKAGRKLGDLYCGYEKVKPWAECAVDVVPGYDSPYHVTKMRFAKKENPKDENKNGKLDRHELEDRSRIIYNDRVTIRGWHDDVESLISRSKTGGSTAAQIIEARLKGSPFVDPSSVKIESMTSVGKDALLDQIVVVVRFGKGEAGRKGEKGAEK